MALARATVPRLAGRPGAAPDRRPAPVHVSAAARAETWLPGRRSVSADGLLGLSARGDVAVVDGRAWRCEAQAAGPAEPCLRLDGGSLRLRPDESLRAGVVRSLEQGLRDAALDGAGEGGPRRYGWLDVEMGRLAPRPLQQVAAFVAERLIPRLRRLRPAAAARLPVEEMADAWLAGLEDRFLFASGRWYRLVPFHGDAEPHQPEVRLGAECYLGLSPQPARLALARYDESLHQAIGEATQGSAAAGALFARGRHVLVRTPAGHHFLCQRVPPYVVEGEDRQLYAFGPVEIGIHIDSLQVRQVIRPVCVRVMGEYRHMFIGGYGPGGYVCMPRSPRYFTELHELPLEDALLRHLESARMTLCAGYRPPHSAYHPIRSVGRPTITEVEAERRGWPVYRYYRTS
ncbi:MAG: hypothetical protein ABIL09_25600, partial [Gemmatimonadota bacterium]